MCPQIIYNRFYGIKAAFTPYLPQEQNSGVSFRPIFFMVLSNYFFKDVYLDSFIGPFFFYASAMERTAFTYRFGASVLFCYSICSPVEPVQGELFLPRAAAFFPIFIIWHGIPLSPFSFAFYTIINEDFWDKTPCIRRSLSMPCKQNIADKIIYIFAPQLPAEFNFVILCLACSLCSLRTAPGLR